MANQMFRYPSLTWDDQKSMVAMYVARIIRTNLAEMEATEIAFIQITVGLPAMTSVTGIPEMNNVRYSNGFEVWRVKRYDFIECVSCVFIFLLGAQYLSEHVKQDMIRWKDFDQKFNRCRLI
jgi:hypothetical protein